MKTLSDPQCRNDIERRIRSVTPTSPRKWGRMTSQQMLLHVYESFLVPLGEKQVSPKKMPAVVKWGALWFPMRWPQGVKTRPELDQAERMEAVSAAFEPDRDRLLAALQRFCTTDSSTFSPHPNFGKLSAREWMRWGYLHTDHHLRQFGS